jgi:DNA-binding transcriptional LysR family regulator
MTNMRTFDLNLLRVLDAVLAEGQVSAAARRLNLSQPATSAALARLREALGDPLLLRSGNRMRMTPMAEALRPQVRRVLADIEQALRVPAGFDPAVSERSFRILANDYAATVVLAPLAGRLARSAPRVGLEILPFEDRFAERLATDEYDLAVRDGWAMRGWRRRESLFREDYVGLVRIGHPRLSRTPSLEEYLREGHVLVSPAGVVPGTVDQALAGLRRRRRVAITVPHFLAAPGIVAQTDFVVTLARRIAEPLAGAFELRRFPLPLRLPGFDLAMAWHARAETDDGVTWLKEQVRRTVPRAR